MTASAGRKMRRKNAVSALKNAAPGMAKTGGIGMESRPLLRNMSYGNTQVGEFMVAFLLVFTVLRRAVNSLGKFDVEPSCVVYGNRITPAVIS